MAEISQKADTLSGAAISDEPLVLIVHTHGTEAFSNELPYYNTKTNYPRSTDPSKNVIAVGKELKVTCATKKQREFTLADANAHA